MSLSKAIDVVGYERKDGKRPFAEWWRWLDSQVRYKIQEAVERMRNGNFSNAKPVGQGVSEYRLNFGPGYRIYFGMDGEKLVILLGGGTKKRQRNDIEKAKELWKEYKSRKKEGDIEWH